MVTGCCDVVACFILLKLLYSCNNHMKKTLFSIYAETIPDCCLVVIVTYLLIGLLVTS